MTLTHRIRSRGTLIPVLLTLEAVALIAMFSSKVRAEDRRPSPAEKIDEPPRSASPWSQDVSPRDQQAAAKLFVEANSLMDDISFAEADKKYAKAIALWDHPVFHFNRSIAQVNLLQSIEAYDSLLNALRYGKQPYNPKQYARALKAKKTLEEALTRVDIQCTQKGVEAFLDGKPLMLDKNKRCLDRHMVRPGGHQLMATKDKHETHKEQIVANAGEHLKFKLKLKPRAGVILKRPFPRWQPWTVFGAGVPAVIAGVVYHSRASNRFRSFDQNFRAPGICSLEGCARGEEGIGAIFSEYDEGARFRTISLALYGTGVAVMTAGLIWAFLNQPRIVTKKKPASQGFQLAPQVDGNRTGLMLSSSF